MGGHAFRVSIARFRVKLTWLRRLAGRRARAPPDTSDPFRVPATLMSSGPKEDMDLLAKIRTLPNLPGCYLYKNAEGEVIYVGKAKNLRARVRSYFLAASQANAKTGS